MWKIYIRKILIVNLIFFNSLTSVNAEFQLATLPLRYLSFAKKDWTASLYFPVYLARFSNCMQRFQLEKMVCIKHWNLMNEQKQLLKKLIVWSKSLKNIKGGGSILVKWTIAHNINNNKTLHRHILICLALFSNGYFVEDLPWLFLNE